MAPRLPSNLAYESARATLSLAGVRQVVQASVGPLTGAGAEYTVVQQNTRRVIVIHLGAATPAAGNIRFNYRPQGGDVAADAEDIPILPETYFVVDAEKGDILSFFNTSASTIIIYLMEIE